MRVLFLGDIVGAIGRKIVENNLSKIITENNIDFAIVNGENATHGKGLSFPHYKALVESGANAITLGNHWRSKAQIDKYIDKADLLIRPLNLLNYHHGVGTRVFRDNRDVEIRVTNLLGQAFMLETVNNPITKYEALIEKTGNNPVISFVDYHAESTSEKQIFANFFDGKVSLVVGTHTHVATSDYRILPNGTAFITDAGMCGAVDSIIGCEINSVIKKVVNGQRCQFETPKKGLAMINGVIVNIDDKTGKAIDIKQFYLEEEIL